jgi:hypothetical protein
MRPLLGSIAVLLALAVTGCGDDSGADSGAAAEEPTSPILVSGTSAGGETEARATRLPDDQALAAYAEQFRGSLPDDLVEAAGSVEVGDDEVLVAQVVSVGCDVPDAATIHGEVVKADKVPSPLKECLAPVTTVALTAMPQEG